MRPTPRIDPRARGVAQWLLTVGFDRYLTTHVSGVHHVPPEGVPTLVTANHSSSLDVFAGGYAVGRPGFFLAKAEIVRLPLAGRFLRACGAIPAQRTGRDIAALKEMVAVLSAGHLLGVAPEGTRSPTGELLPYDPGFVWLARRTGAVVVPCAIHGTWQLMPKGRRLPRRGPVWIAFGEPVDVAAEQFGGDDRAAADQVRTRTLELLLELARQSGLAGPQVAVTREAATSQSATTS